MDTSILRSLQTKIKASITKTYRTRSIAFTSSDMNSGDDVVMGEADN
jgi:hypothetical protein